MLLFLLPPLLKPPASAAAAPAAVALWLPLVVVVVVVELALLRFDVARRNRAGTLKPWPAGLLPAAKASGFPAGAGCCSVVVVADVEDAALAERDSVRRSTTVVVVRRSVNEARVVVVVTLVCCSSPSSSPSPSSSDAENWVSRTSGSSMRNETFSRISASVVGLRSGAVAVRRWRAGGRFSSLDSVAGDLRLSGFACPAAAEAPSWSIALFSCCAASCESGMDWD